MNKRQRKKRMKAILIKWLERDYRKGIPSWSEADERDWKKIVSSVQIINEPAAERNRNKITASVKL